MNEKAPGNKARLQYSLMFVGNSSYTTLFLNYRGKGTFLSFQPFSNRLNKYAVYWRERAPIQIFLR
jgi:hypothetical protein